MTAISKKKKKKSKELPKFRAINQSIVAPHIDNIQSTLNQKLQTFGLASRIDTGDSVAITGSSRGIDQQSIILKTIVSYVKNCGAHPFIIPAMGSHGGGTAEGQKGILNSYGITDKIMGCPIKASMEVVKVAESEFKTPIYIDKYAYEANKIIVVNRIKSHSKFNGKVQSGLSKMCLMGLGKQKGAKLYHRLAEQYGWQKIVNSMRRTIVKKMPIICAIGVIMNNSGKLAEIHAVEPNNLGKIEPKLLKRSKHLTANIPFKNIDLLIVDEMGKNIFGTGMDTTITRRKNPKDKSVQYLFVRDLTEETHGNAQGVGLADFTTKKLVDKIDRNQMYYNALTAFRTDSAKIPIYLDSDRDVINTVIKLSGKTPKKMKIAWIKNTLKLEKMLISEDLFEEAQKISSLSFISKEEEIKFDGKGFLMNSLQYFKE